MGDRINNTVFSKKVITSSLKVNHKVYVIIGIGLFSFIGSLNTAKLFALGTCPGVTVVWSPYRIMAIRWLMARDTAPTSYVTDLDPRWHILPFFFLFLFLQKLCLDGFPWRTFIWRQVGRLPILLWGSITLMWIQLLVPRFSRIEPAVFLLIWSVIGQIWQHVSLACVVYHSQCVKLCSVELRERPGLLA